MAAGAGKGGCFVVKCNGEEDQRLATGSYYLQTQTAMTIVCIRTRGGFSR